MLRKGLHVLPVVPQGQQAAVNFRMQGFQPSVHHFRKARVVRDLGHPNAAVPDLGRRSSGGENLDVEIRQSPGKRDDARLVRDADQGPRNPVQFHDIHLTVVSRLIYTLPRIACMCRIRRSIRGAVPMSGR